MPPLTSSHTSHTPRSSLSGLEASICVSGMGNWILVTTGHRVHSMRLDGTEHTSRWIDKLAHATLVGGNQVWAIADGALYRFNLPHWETFPWAAELIGTNEALTKIDPDFLSHGPRLVADTESRSLEAVWHCSLRGIPLYGLIGQHEEQTAMWHPPAPLPHGCLFRPAGNRLLVAVSGQILIHDLGADAVLLSIPVPVPGDIVGVEIDAWGQWIIALVDTGDSIGLLRMQPDGSVEHHLRLPRFDSYCFDADQSTLAFHLPEERALAVLDLGPERPEPARYVRQLAAPFPIDVMRWSGDGMSLHLFHRRASGWRAASRHPSSSVLASLGIESLALDRDELVERSHARLLRHAEPVVATPGAGDRSGSNSDSNSGSNSDSGMAPGALFGGRLDFYVRASYTSGSLPALAGLASLNRLLLRTSRDPAQEHFRGPRDYLDTHIDAFELIAALALATDHQGGYLTLRGHALDEAKQLMAERVRLPMLDVPQLIPLGRKLGDDVWHHIEYRRHGTARLGKPLPFLDLVDEFQLSPREVYLLLAIAIRDISPAFGRFVELATQALGLPVDDEAVLRYLVLADGVEDTAPELLPGGRLRETGLVQAVPTIPGGERMFADPVVMSVLQGRPCRTESFGKARGAEGYTRIIGQESGMIGDIGLGHLALGDVAPLLEALARPRADGHLHRVILIGEPGSGRRELARVLARRTRRDLAVIDGSRLCYREQDAAAALCVVMQRARMRNAIPYLEGMVYGLSIRHDARSPSTTQAMVEVCRAHQGALFVAVNRADSEAVTGELQGDLNSRDSHDHRVMVPGILRALAGQAQVFVMPERAAIQGEETDRESPAPPDTREPGPGGVTRARAHRDRQANRDGA